MKHVKIIGSIWFVIALIVAVFAVNGISMDNLTRDPAQVRHFPVYIGLLSNIGSIMWCLAAAISLFTAGYIWRINGRAQESSFLGVIGLITCLLMIDDLFLVHDVIFPVYFHIPEIAMYIFYVSIAILMYKYFALFIQHNTEYTILMLSILLTGISVIMDMNIFPGGIDVEDTFKLFGITAYSYYCVVTSGRLLVASIVQTKK